MNIKKEAISAGSIFQSPAKQYRLSKRGVLVDTFDREAIRRKVYQLYEAKEHVTLSKLLVTSRVKVIETFAKALLAIQVILREGSVFSGKRTSFQRQLKEMGFRYSSQQAYLLPI